MLNANAAADSIAASASGSSSAQAVHHARHVPSAAQRRTLGPISAHRRRRLGLSPPAPSSTSPPPASAASTSKRGSTSASARQRPSAWSLLVQHARRTSRLSDVAVGVGANATRQERTAAAARAPLWRVMGHTYFMCVHAASRSRSHRSTPLMSSLPQRALRARSSPHSCSSKTKQQQGCDASALDAAASPSATLPAGAEQSAHAGRCAVLGPGTCCMGAAPSCQPVRPRLSRLCVARRRSGAMRRQE